MTIARCPVCGHAASASAQPDVSFVAATGEIRYRDRKCTVQPLQLDIFDELLAAYPHKVPFDLLFRLLYKVDPNPHALDDRNRLRVHISLLRRALRKAGLALTIDAHQDRGPNAPHMYALRVLDHVPILLNASSAA